VYVIKRIPVSGTDPAQDAIYEEARLPNPNRYAGQITVEVRVHFPPHVKHLAVMTAYDKAFDEVEQEYVNRYVLPDLHERLKQDG
jgi:hypothetical protein